MRQWLLIAVAAAASSVALAVDHVALGMQADEAGNFDEAIRHFTLHAEDNPEDATAHNNLGVATMRYGIEMMMVRRRLKGKKLFIEAADHYRTSLRLDNQNTLAGDNLRGVLHALESNFQVPPTDEDKVMLEVVGFPYEDFDSDNAVPEDDPVHDRIKKKLGVNEDSTEEMGAEGGQENGKKRRLGALSDKYKGEEEEEGGEEDDNEAGSREDDEARELAEEAEAARQEAEEDARAAADAEDDDDEHGKAEAMRQAELTKIRALKNPYIRAIKLFEANEISEAVESLCTPEQIRVTPKPKEVAAGKPAFKTVARAAATLKVCGVVIVEDVIPEAVADSVAESVKAMTSGRMASVDVSADGEATFERADMAKRSEGRYEFFNPLEAPFSSPAVIENAFVMPIVRRAMGPRVEIDTFSTVTSQPGAPVQHWHQDAGPLFPKAGMHLPAHGVVSFVPVESVTSTMGPTEFVPGSHVQCGRDEKPTPRFFDDGTILDLCKAVPTNRVLFADTKRGSAILFDFRVYHRGGPNTSDKQRPLLYTTYLREWYYDKVNFQQTVSKRFDAMTPQQRKLLNRVEHRQFARKLVSQVKELGGDPEESSYDFTVYTYDVKKTSP